MDVIYKCGRATVAEVMERLDNPPSYSAVRAHLRILEEKGALRHEQEGQKYVFLPTITREKAKQSALKRMLHVFFNDSTEAAVVALLDISQTRMTDEDWDRLASLIDDAKKRG